ncbi:MoxR family ATPase [Herbiconiux sp. CPCC 203407]|uniref:MoxR family ATPase n=1 Tax=Herbiconiux oxytropis TaxID=2970915 RepID=A0AA42BV61_9MICO|nr:MoxR family ATPase [Herbiconiux oxytropis]MCS5720521.1 MoxR family ATPase [Herbiconiux oxytropis]MCS5726094.1 MoxR family ATPase [Herbiconiux oxytropis]
MTPEQAHAPAPERTGQHGQPGQPGRTAPLTLEEFGEHTGAILANLESVIDGKTEAATLALIVLIAEGHLLVEDVPGVGKTTLAKALATSVGCTVSRIQFTPDLLPSDVTGVSIYNQSDHAFEFKRGAVFANIVIADEINRASPKTQSALLECMEEGQVSVDGTTHPLEPPFIVVATQNPIEMEGTYALPEAQRDRFMARLSMGYPDAAAELSMLHHRETQSPLDRLTAVVDKTRLAELIATARAIYVSRAVESYVVSLVQATRTHPEFRLGASPRGTLHLVRAAKVLAALNGREFVVPDDVNQLVVPVLAHRIVATRRAAGDARGGGTQAIAEALRGIIAATPVPLTRSRSA